MLVGGGAKNLGGIVSRTFASEGARVVVHFNSSATKPEADKAVASIKAAGGDAIATQGDFTNVADVVATFAAAKRQYGGIDIAINTVGKVLNDGGKICTIVTSLLAAYTGLYSTYGGMKAPVEHFTRAASKEFGGRSISVTAVGPGPMDTPFFFGQETPEAVAYHKSASALGGLTKIEDIVPLIKFLVTDGWWITGQTIFANGGYTTR